MAQTLELMDIPDLMFGGYATIHYAGMWFETVSMNIREIFDKHLPRPYCGVVINVSSTATYKPRGKMIFEASAFGGTVFILERDDPFVEPIPAAVSVDKFGDTFGENPGHWYTLRADGTWRPPTDPRFTTPQIDTRLAEGSLTTAEGKAMRERITMHTPSYWAKVRLSWIPSEEE